MHIQSQGLDFGKVQTVSNGTVRNAGATIWIKWWIFKFTVYFERDGLEQLKKKIENVLRKLPE